MSARRETGEEIVVVSREHGLPFSKGLLAQSIMAAGLGPARSYALARLVDERLRDRREPEITVPELRALTEEVLAEQEGEAAVTRFQRWQRLPRLERPLVVLLGGATGTGKSTLATLLAHRLGINRVSATDLIRQVLRAFFSHEFMPAVHYSSFEADAAVRLRRTNDDPELIGFLRQAEDVATGVCAIVERAVIERTPIVFEGVHLLPGLLPGDLAERALLVHAVLAVSDEELHRSHFYLRGAAPAPRPADRYLARFDTIRKLQRFIVAEAAGAGIPVIENHALDSSLATLVELVLDAIAAAEPQHPAAAQAHIQEDAPA